MNGEHRASDRRPVRVLVAEDEAIVSMFIEVELGDAGYDVVGPFATCADACQWLASETPDIALLDHSLRDGPCTDVAIELRRRGIPYVALTGSDRDELPEAFRDAPYLEKPVDAALLPKLLARILSASRAPGSASHGRTAAPAD